MNLVVGDGVGGSYMELISLLVWDDDMSFDKWNREIECGKEDDRWVVMMVDDMVG